MKPNEFIVEVDFTEDEERISVGGRNIEIPQVVFLKPDKEWFEPDPNPRADWKGLPEKLRSELRAMGNDDAGTATFRFEFGDEADPQKKREFMECVRQYHLGAEAEETETVKNVQDYLAEAQRYRENNNEAAAFQRYEDAAKMYDNAQAQYEVALCYQNGRGTEKNEKKAAEWYRKAAEHGHAEAQFWMGERYYCGDGVEKDFAKTVEWCRMAARQGHADAQWRLGRCYGLGEGVEKNYEKAVEYYSKAAEQGQVKAQNNLAVCYINGSGLLRRWSGSARQPSRALQWRSTIWACAMIVAMV